MSLRQKARALAITLLSLGLVLAIGACGGERVTGAPASPPPPSGSPFTTLTVRAIVEPGAASLANALGWSSGMPGATVHLLRVGTET